jgi:hypothetical protein
MGLPSILLFFLKKKGLKEGKDGAATSFQKNVQF